ncbi:MAG: DNA-directed polymerase delta subunit [Firmicutes bacterium]|nr:DNA-directed polymerase delta subunit [Bacillota bacterium]
MIENGKRVSEVDLAHAVLAQEGRALYFRDLITKVLERKDGQNHFLPHAMAEVHTQINMDSRFVYMGKGMWGLHEWVPQRGGVVLDENERPAVRGSSGLRREKLLAEIQQQDCVTTTEEDNE